MRHEHSLLGKPLQFFFAHTQFAEHLFVVFALESRRADRRQFIAGEVPGTARQSVFAAAAIWNELDRAQ